MRRLLRKVLTQGMRAECDTRLWQDIESTAKVQLALEIEVLCCNLEFIQRSGKG